MRGELETEQTATYWPPVLLSLSALLSRSAGLLNRGSWGPIALCWMLVLSTASYLRLTDSNSLNFLSHRVIQLFDCHLLPVSVAFAPNSTRPRSRLYLDVFDRMHLFLDWRLGRRSICYIVGVFPVGLSCRIHRLLFCRGVRPQNDGPRYDTRQPDGEIPVMQELWRITITLRSILVLQWKHLMEPYIWAR